MIGRQQDEKLRTNVARAWIGSAELIEHSSARTCCDIKEECFAFFIGIAYLDPDGTG
jgi:hypothetical protein